jgi:hypothetical protein
MHGTLESSTAIAIQMRLCNVSDANKQAAAQG